MAETADRGGGRKGGTRRRERVVVGGGGGGGVGGFLMLGGALVAAALGAAFTARAVRKKRRSVEREEEESVKKEGKAEVSVKSDGAVAPAADACEGNSCCRGVSGGGGESRRVDEEGRGLRGLLLHSPPPAPPPCVPPLSPVAEEEAEAEVDLSFPHAPPPAEEPCRHPAQPTPTAVDSAALPTFPPLSSTEPPSPSSSYNNHRHEVEIAESPGADQIEDAAAQEEEDEPTTPPPPPMPELQNHTIQTPGEGEDATDVATSEATGNDIVDQPDVARLQEVPEETVVDESNVARLQEVPEETVVDESSVARLQEVPEETVVDESSVARLQEVPEETVVDESSIARLQEVPEETVVDESNVARLQEVSEETVIDESNVARPQEVPEETIVDESNVAHLQEAPEEIIQTDDTVDEADGALVQEETKSNSAGEESNVEQELEVLQETVPNPNGAVNEPEVEEHVHEVPGDTASTLVVDHPNVAQVHEVPETVLNGVLDGPNVSEESADEDTEAADANEVEDGTEDEEREWASDSEVDSSVESSAEAIWPAEASESSSFDEEEYGMKSRFDVVKDANDEQEAPPKDESEETSLLFFRGERAQMQTGLSTTMVMGTKQSKVFVQVASALLFLIALLLVGHHQDRVAESYHHVYKVLFPSLPAPPPPLPEAL